MAWVSEVPEAQASGKLKSLYDELRAKGGVSEFFRVQGQTPAVAAAQLALVVAALTDGALLRVQKEQLFVVVSGINTSSYCVARHLDLLRSFGMENQIARKLAVDYANAPVDSRMQPLFRFADKLTRHPENIEQADVDAMSAAGWSEAAVREAVQVVALANFTNRISIGLGLMADF